MAYELIHEVHQCRHEWGDALDRPFDAEVLANIKARYDRALRMDETYRKVYENARAACAAEQQEMHERMWEIYSPLSKGELAERIGYQPKGATKAEMIEQLCDRAISGSVKSAHQRVKEIWSAMSDAEREGSK